jgi:ESAT-6 protein secretion system EspG family protein
MTIFRAHSTAPWQTPLSLPAWQELWRMFSDRGPMPVVLDLPRSDGVLPRRESAEQVRRLRADLVAGGYAARAGESVRPSQDVQAMLRVLARPHREIDLRMNIRGESVRMLAAAPLRGNVVRVTIHEAPDVRDSVVAIESVETSAPELAAVELLPPSPGPGRIRARSIPVDQLERAIDGYRSHRFIDALTTHIGKAAGEVHELLRHGHTMRAKFGIAARDAKGSRVRHPFALVVHDSAQARHVLARRGAHITIDRADDRQIMTMLGQRLSELTDRAW